MFCLQSGYKLQHSNIHRCAYFCVYIYIILYPLYLHYLYSSNLNIVTNLINFTVQWLTRKQTMKVASLESVTESNYVVCTY